MVVVVIVVTLTVFSVDYYLALVPFRLLVRASTTTPSLGVVALIAPSHPSVGPFVCSQTYRLFDNIVLMGEGKIMYHGPREDIVPYFNSLG